MRGGREAEPRPTNWGFSASQVSRPTPNHAKSAAPRRWCSMGYVKEQRVVRHSSRNTSPETARASMCALVSHTAAGLALEAAPETPHHGCAKRREPPAYVTLLSIAEADLNQRGAARTRGELVCCATSLETANASARALASHTAAGLVLEAAAGTSHHNHAAKKISAPRV